MTIDEAINKLEHGIEQLTMELKSGLWEVGSDTENAIKEGIKDNEQLIAWLIESKEAKRLLKVAVESLRWLALHTEDSYGSCVIRDDNAHNKCDNCPLDNPEYTDCKWEYEAEALKLIGDESSGI